MMRDTLKILFLCLPILIVGCLTEEHKSKDYSWGWKSDFKADSTRPDSQTARKSPERVSVDASKKAPDSPVKHMENVHPSTDTATLPFAPLSTSGTSQSPLYVDTDLLWPENKIQVCWVNPDSTNGQERRWVEDAITSTWQAHTPVRFVGWGWRCPLDMPGFKGVRIRVEDTEKAPHTGGLGVSLVYMPTGMSLNFTFKNWCPACRTNREAAIRTIAVHEFGHAMGFAHEQNRHDTPQLPVHNALGLNTVDWCAEEHQGADGVTPFGGWDLQSTMNYCNPNWAGNGQLSKTDIDGANYFYGTPRGCPSGKFSTGAHKNCMCFTGTKKVYEGIGDAYATCKGDSAPNCPYGLFSTTDEYKACRCPEGKKVYQGLFNEKAHCSMPDLICPEGQFNTLSRYYDCQCPAGSEKDYYDPLKIMAMCKGHIRDCPSNGKFETIGEFKGCTCPVDRPRKVYYGLGDFYGECRLTYCPSGRFSTTGGNHGCECPPDRPHKKYYGIFDSEASCN